VEREGMEVNKTEISAGDFDLPEVELSRKDIVWFIIDYVHNYVQREFKSGPVMNENSILSYVTSSLYELYDMGTITDWYDLFLHDGYVTFIVELPYPNDMSFQSIRVGF
jgi:hypothetical protein